MRAYVYSVVKELLIFVLPVLNFPSVGNEKKINICQRHMDGYINYKLFYIKSQIFPVFKPITKHGVHNTVFFYSVLFFLAFFTISELDALVTALYPNFFFKLSTT